MTDLLSEGDHLAVGNLIAVGQIGHLLLQLRDPAVCNLQKVGHVRVVCQAGLGALVLIHGGHCTVYLHPLTSERYGLLLPTYGELKQLLF